MMRILILTLATLLALAGFAAGQGHVPPSTGGSAEIVQQQLGPFFIPAIPGSGVSASGLTFSASGHKICYVFQAPKTGTIDEIGVRIAAVTNNPDNGIKFSLQNIDTTTGVCDGVADQYRDYTTALTANTYITSGLLTDDGTDNGTKRTVTVGDVLGLQIEFVNFTASDAFVIEAQTSVTSTAPVAGSFYIGFYNGSAWAKTRNLATMSLHYSDGSIPALVPNWVPYETITTKGFANDDDPDEYALRFTVPGPVTVSGAWFRADIDADAEVILYDAEDTVIAGPTTLDSDIRASTSTEHFVIRWPDVELDANTVYRLAIRPTTTTNILIYYFDFAAAEYQSAIEGSNSSWYTSTRVDEGEWTDTTTRRLIGGLIVSKIGAPE